MALTKVRGAGAEGLTLSSTALTVANGLTLTDGNVTLASGHGIDFAATSDASGQSSELLDDYEEGTFTPSAEGETTAGTYSNSFRVGTYVRVGLMVYVSGVLNGSISGSAGAARVTGLPFTKDSNDTGLATVQWNNMPFNSLGEEDHQTTGLVDSNYIHFRANDRRVNEALTQLTWSNGNIAYFRFSAVYRTS
jgi:hypothetical protein